MVRASVAHYCLQYAKVAAEQELPEGVGLPPSLRLPAARAQHYQFESYPPETVPAIHQGTAVGSANIGVR